MNQVFSTFFFFITLYLPFCNHEVRQLPKAESSIVFVHLGKTLPDYLPAAIKQAKLFNECPIIVVANRKALKKTSLTGVIEIAYETLAQSESHKKFNEHSKLDRGFRNGFWHYASERFFVLDDLIKKYQLKNVVHLESDVMLYQDISNLLPTLQANYKGIAVPFDNDTRAIPSFVYIPNAQAIEKFTAFSANLEGTYDMEAFGAYRNVKCHCCIDSLPIVDSCYIESEVVSSDKPKTFDNYVEQFDSLFDAAYFGQYLGGTDPRNNDSNGSYVNPHCSIVSSKMEYVWETDREGRSVPYAIYNGVKRRINNLHIHSKQLEKFSSLVKK